MLPDLASGPAHRSASTSTCRSALPDAGTATSTPTRPPSWAAPTPTAGWPRCASSWGWPRAPRRPLAPVRTVFVGGGTPSLLGGPGWPRCSTRSASTSPGPRRRGHHRVQPGVHVAASSSPTLRAAGFTRISLGMQSTAPHVLAALDRVHSPGRALDAARRGPRRGLRPRQPRPHLRHAGGDRRRSARLDRRRHRGRRRPRVGVRADRRGRHRAGPPGSAR